MTCKGICIRFKANRPTDSNGYRYSAGQKRCQTCQIFMITEGLTCPCCHYKLRLRPRNMKAKAKFRSIKLIQLAHNTQHMNQSIELKLIIHDHKALTQRTWRCQYNGWVQCFETIKSLDEYAVYNARRFNLISVLNYYYIVIFMLYSEC